LTPKSANGWREWLSITNKCPKEEGSPYLSLRLVHRFESNYYYYYQ